MDTCTACKALAPMGLQCNKHARIAPGASTRTRTSIVRMVREQGVTVAEAESAHGVTAGPVIR